ncbi:MAG: hypothetical protein ABF966_09110 [Bifidobacterium psychraerophilum]|uniref:hypothetical protein n=1 Tax=Bifidobacterium psychraerophilum TaxID=218140 RepID=UPI0039ED7B1D
MRKIKLNRATEKGGMWHGYVLCPTSEYVINLKDEESEQDAILRAVQAVGEPPALVDYRQWLTKNGCDVVVPNSIKGLVKEHYGKKALWENEFSRGIVVKAEGEDDYYIVVECSHRNKSFEYAQIVVNPSGCV